MKKITFIIGKISDFTKSLSIYEALKGDFALTLIYIGPHFDSKKNDVFFNQLKFHQPDVHLTLEKKTKAGDFDNKLYVENKEYLKNKDNAIEELMKYDGDLGQLGEICDKLKVVFKKLKSDLIIVFGDTTSTLAAGLVAKMLNIELAHMKSRIHNGGIKIPEEVNRILTDRITKYHFVTEKRDVDNLKEMNISENVYLFGNIKLKNIYKNILHNIPLKYDYLDINKIDFNKLLSRKPLVIDNSESIKFLYDKRIMITGGAGSIGSEIIVQLLLLGINNIYVIDNSEYGEFTLINKLKKMFPTNTVKFYLRDINNNYKITEIFKLIQPNIVFHVAAYKHVPMMENNPYESINTNVLGTKNIVDNAIKYNVEKFLFVSTDKAVNPTNVMGATKRISELYVLYSNNISKTDFVITRFGNVLGSSGSVIPTFIQNINDNRNLEITHKNIIRYFMSISEAASLVIKAITIGKGNQILIFDMGNPIKILDLAKNIIKLSSKNISIKFTGLRPGEKMYEELLCKEEKILPTDEKKIMILKNNEENNNFIEKYNNLINNFNNLSECKLRQAIQILVPNYSYQPLVI
jgi:FlaA1/EpsC-like NDP-sugar epimerase